MTSTRKGDIVGGVIGSLASVQAAQTTVDPQRGIIAPIPPPTSHDKSLHAQFDALFKAVK